jgi:hypothetical protein
MHRKSVSGIGQSVQFAALAIISLGVRDGRVPKSRALWLDALSVRLQRPPGQGKAGWGTLKITSSKHEDI